VASRLPSRDLNPTPIPAEIRAAVRQTIREELDELPDVYDCKLWEDKVERTYQFIFERMGGVVRH